MHEAGETTSLSNLFKASQSKGVRTRKLSIQDLQPPSAEEEINPLEAKSNSLFEREKMLETAQSALEIEKEKVTQMKQAAITKIEAMKTAWQEEKTILQQEAYEEGFQVGFSEGREKALADMQGSLEEANAITEQSKKLAEEYQESQERVILELAMRSASRILNEQLKADEEKFLTIVQRAILEVREMKEVKLYISAKYYPLVSANRSELAAILPPETPFLIFVNEDFDASECYIETNHGRIVVTIDEQLSELREQLIDLLERGD